MANQPVQTVNTVADKGKVYGALLLALAAVVGFYLLGKQGALVQWLVLLVGLAAAIVVYLFSESGKELIALFRDSWRELKKVVWPSRKEAMQLTLYVFGFVVLMALMLWLTDKTLEWVLYDLILGWRK
ncbi:MAG: preprotein translocase subunit SecE [Cytophagales bacterium]|nr:preprotein translocase subunit SecE [Cytophagales bacterium]